MEIWKDIKDYEGFYQVSNKGNVRNLQKNKNLTLSVKRKYNQCALSKNNNKTYFFVHRLICDAFLDNPLSKEQVNHIDGNKLNNDLSNLEWVTRSENQLHAYRTGLQISKKGMPTLSSKTIIQLSKDGFLIETFEGYSIAQQKTGINRTCIFECVNGKQKTAGGYIWM